MTFLELGNCQKIYCNTCKIETHHELKVILPRFYEDVVEDGPDPSQVTCYRNEYEYRLWVCRGCDTVTFEEFHAILVDGEHFDEWDESALYPLREKRALNHYRNLNDKLVSFYSEVITSFNAGLRTICAMGLRALLEGICVDKGITDEKAWGLEGKLEKLEKKLEEEKRLPVHIADALLSFKFMGDDAVHRLEPPETSELEKAIEVMEKLLSFAYNLEHEELLRGARALAAYRIGRIARFRLEKTKRKHSVGQLF